MPADPDHLVVGRDDPHKAADDDKPRMAPFPAYARERAGRKDQQDENYDSSRQFKQGFEDNLWLVTKHIERRRARLDKLDVTPSPEVVRRVVAAIPDPLPDEGALGDTMHYLMQRFLPGCLPAQNGPRYFGFVTGGTTDAAQLADLLVTSYDENVQVTLPDTSASTALEGRALEWVLDLLGIPRDVFVGRTITTGATASNVLGLGECGCLGCSGLGPPASHVTRA